MTSVMVIVRHYIQTYHVAISVQKFMVDREC